jgi:hypothetical protein
MFVFLSFIIVLLDHGMILKRVSSCLVDWACILEQHMCARSLLNWDWESHCAVMWVSLYYRISHRIQSAHGSLYKNYATAVCNYPSTVQLSRTSLFICFTCVHHCSPYDFGMTDSGVIKACQQHKMLKTLGSPHANSNVHSRLVATSLSGKATTVPHPRQSRQAKANAICMR